MLDAYIIEEIKRQEEERRRREDAARPRLRIEIPDRTRREEPTETPEEQPPPEEDGIIRIDLRGS